MYELGPDGRKELGKKAQEYAFSEFGMEKTVKRWDETLTDLTNNWKKNYTRWDVTEI